MDMEDAVVRYDIYSRSGKLLDSKATLVEAERLLAAWFDAKFVIAVDAAGEQRVVAERNELH